MKRTLLALLVASGFALAVQGFNPVKNSSFETADPLNPNLAKDWQVLGNNYTRAPTTGAWDGSYVLQVTSGAGAVQRVFFNQTSAVPIRISTLVSGSGVGNDSSDKLGASLDCKIAYHDGSFAWCPVTFQTKSVGTFDWKQVGYNTFNLPGGGNPIDWIDVRVRMGNVSGTAWFDDVHAEEWLPKTNGLVTFMFDDSLLSTYDKAFPVLRSYGFPGTEAVVTSYVGGDSAHMTWDNLGTLATNGWSMVSHTVTHQDLTAVSLGSLNDEIYWSQKYLLDHGFNAEHLALPFGAYNAQVQERVQAQLYKSMRSTDKGLNPQGVFPYNIHARSVYSYTTVADVMDWLDEARAERAWLVLLFHEIDVPNGIYTTSSSTFRNVAEAVKLSGLPVVTYDRGFDLMTAR